MFTQNNVSSAISIPPLLMYDVHCFMKCIIFVAASPICSTLLGLYKKLSEPFYITQCVSNLLKAMIERDLQIIDGIIEPLFTALFVQVCQFSAVSSENVDNFKRRNHYEVLR